MLEVINHHFIGGVYAKEMRIPEGFKVVSHQHEFDHMSVLTSGCVIVEANGEQNTYWSPAIIEIKAGVAHSVTPVNGDAHWLCIHKTDCTDDTKVDEVLIQKQEHMRKMHFTVSVDDLIKQLNKSEFLWNQHTLRTQAEDSPHREVDDIWLRYRDLKDFDPQNPQAFAGEHESVWYDSICSLPAVRIIANYISAMIPNIELGGILITRIPKGSQVYPHSDAGYWHSEYYDKKLLVLVESDEDQSFCFENAEYKGKAGEVFEFDNRPTHWVINNSNKDRISLIFATRIKP